MRSPPRSETRRDSARERATLLLDHGFEGALKIVGLNCRQYASRVAIRRCDGPRQGIVVRNDAGATTGPFAHNHENLSEIARAFIGPNDAASVERFLEIVD